MIITIDGPSGTGKSTVAKLVAKKLGFLFLDTGAIYRSLAYYFIKHHLPMDQNEFILQAAQNFDLDIKKDLEGNYTYWLESEDISQVIRQESISKQASSMAKNPLVRELLLPLQRTFGKNRNLVTEGRDTGTVVFPEAEIKIFLDALPEVRAQRRLEQLQQKFPNIHHDYDKILMEMQERDTQDSSRKTAPLKKASEAEIIDTSEMTIDQVVSEIINLAEKIRGR